MAVLSYMSWTWVETARKSISEGGLEEQNNDSRYSETIKKDSNLNSLSSGTIHDRRVFV